MAIAQETTTPRPGLQIIPRENVDRVFWGVQPGDEQPRLSAEDAAFLEARLASPEPPESVRPAAPVCRPKRRRPYGRRRYRTRIQES